MTILELIAEWRRGCACAPNGQPEECPECTRALIDAIEREERLLEPPTLLDPADPIDGSNARGRAYMAWCDREIVNLQEITDLAVAEHIASDLLYRIPQHPPFRCVFVPIEPEEEGDIP